MAKKEVKDNPTPRGYANEEQVLSDPTKTPDPQKTVGLISNQDRREREE